MGSCGNLNRGDGAVHLRGTFIFASVNYVIMCEEVNTYMYYAERSVKNYFPFCENEAIVVVARLCQHILLLKQYFRKCD